MTEPIWGIMQTAYLTGWVIAAPIGPVNLEIMRRVLANGLPAGIAVGLGAVCVDATYLSLFSVGFGAFLKVSMVQRICFIGGGALLAYLGMAAMLQARRVARASRLEIDTEGENENKPRRSIWKHWAVGFALTASSPMTIAFWSAFSLQFVDISGLQRFAASGALMSGCFSWVLTITLTMTFARRWVGPKTFAAANLLGGACVAYFGILFLARAFELDNFLAGTIMN